MSAEGLICTAVVVYGPQSEKPGQMCLLSKEQMLPNLLCIKVVFIQKISFLLLFTGGLYLALVLACSGGSGLTGWLADW